MVMPPKPELPAPPTLGFLREENRVTEVAIHCTTCARTVTVPIASFKLPDDTPFPALKRHWRRPCGRCGGREVIVRPVYGRAQGQGVETKKPSALR